MGIVVTMMIVMATQVAIARDMPRVKAERQGMSSERLERITEMTQSYVDDKKLAGILIRYFTGV